MQEFIAKHQRFFANYPPCDGGFGTASALGTSDSTYRFDVTDWFGGSAASGN